MSLKDKLHGKKRKDVDGEEPKEEPRSSIV